MSKFVKSLVLALGGKFVNVLKCFVKSVVQSG
jgi:hypothetical protein